MTDCIKMRTNSCVNEKRNIPTTNTFYIDITLYPDSDKIAVWGKDTNRVYRTDDNVAYYEGE